MRSKQISILETAQSLFSIHGIKAVTIDEIVGECGISKKTLYVYFPTKHALVVSVMESILSKLEHTLKMTPLVSPSAIIELQRFFEDLQKNFVKLTYRFLNDIRVYCLEAYQKFIQFLDCNIPLYMAQNINRGKREGLYRTELEDTASAGLYVWMLKNILHDGLFEDEYHRIDFIKGLNSFFLKGLLSSNGQKMIISK
ncbi:MAG: TetR/AcrR family transcriptional regulator [Flectobacillus sp.]|uniref:TetR/AcrR family transcriptional regulator n=1 Tax=Flectobacillus sp. TaxID=50419 RepID=UPI003B9CCFFE